MFPTLETSRRRLRFCWRPRVVKKVADAPRSRGNSGCHRCKALLYSRRLRSVGRALVVVVNGFPKCLKCQVGDLVPLSDFGSQGAAIHFKAWGCTNPDCGYDIKIRNDDAAQKD